MAEQRQFETGVKYLHTDNESLLWNDKPEGAELRVISSGRAQISRIVEHKFEKLGEDGWEEVSESDLSSWEKGRVFYMSVVVRQGQKLNRVECVRLMSEDEAGSVLKGLSPRDEDGRVIASAPSAGRVFLLTEKDASQFVQRVKERQNDGWLVFPAPTDIPTLRKSTDELSTVADQAKRLIDAVEKDFEKLSSGDASGLVKLDAVSEKMWGLLNKARKLSSSIERDAGTFSELGVGSQELTHAAQYRQKGADLLSKVEEAASLFRLQQRRAASLISSQRRETVSGSPEKAWSAHVGELLAQLAKHGMNGWVDGNKIFFEKDGKTFEVDLS